MHESCAHGLALFTRFGWQIKKLRDMASFFLFRQEFLAGGLFDTRVTFLKKLVSFFCSLRKKHYSNDQHQQPTSKSTC
jgi:hypothetical protein